MMAAGLTFEEKKLVLKYYWKHKNAIDHKDRKVQQGKKYLKRLGKVQESL